MPVQRDDARRSVVPQAVGQSLWRAALWTGAGTAVLAAVISIAAVAVAWLPASGGSGSAGSAIRAGLLTFLAALHGGVTVGGVHGMFVPAGMTLLLAVLAWRAGCGLADAAVDLDEDRPAIVLRAAALQVAAFSVPCVVMASAASLGTSSASPVAVFFASLLLFGSCAGAALLRWSVLGDDLAQRIPAWVRAGVRGGVAALLINFVGSAILIAGALVVHHDRVSTLSAAVGGGWSGVPVLVLGLLAAPNALVAGSAYLTGPGFAVGSGTDVTLLSSAHGTLPAFPVLGALPTQHGASWPVWTLAVLTALGAGVYAARGAYRAGRGIARWQALAAAAGLTAVSGVVFAWLGSGSLGDGRLSAVGASPWQFGFAIGVQVGLFGSVALGLRSLGALLRRRGLDTPPPLLAVVTAAIRADAEATNADTPQAKPGETATGKDKLAG